MSVNFSLTNGFVLIAIFLNYRSVVVSDFHERNGGLEIPRGCFKGKPVFLSSFTGGSPGYYSGTFDTSGQLTRTPGTPQFAATKNSNAALQSTYQLTYLKDCYRNFDFSLPDPCNPGYAPVRAD